MTNDSIRKTTKVRSSKVFGIAVLLQSKPELNPVLGQASWPMFEAQALP